MKYTYIIGQQQTTAGEIPIVKTKLDFNDRLGAIMVRWSINRNNYKVDPGLYAVGNPDESSDVFVTANYKLSFDHLRKNLDGLNSWILVLDTKGINVWCAAGKGTFGTKELVHRIDVTNLRKIINHRRIIVPQLGATGVSAYAVKRDTEISAEPVLSSVNQFPKTSFSFAKTGMQINLNRGFNVVFGPIRASDIKAFVKNGYKASKEMRKVDFGFSDRVKLIPVDFASGLKYLLIAIAVVLLLSGINGSGISFYGFFKNGLLAAVNVLLAYISGIVLTPVLLPYISFRPFALKGSVTGALTFVVLLVSGLAGTNIYENISWFLIILAISSFLAMNFTGSSTYTSLSGVKREMKIAVPMQIAFSAVGIILFVLGKLL